MGWTRYRSPFMWALCAKETVKAMLKFHDYHLQKYEVSDHGKTINLFLGYCYPGKETDFSQITFENVVLYNFVQSAHSIITDIEKVTVTSLFSEEKENIETWNRLYSVDCWQNSIESTALFLESNGYSGWHIESAVGFYGFVVAKSVTGT